MVWPMDFRIRIGELCLRAWLIRDSIILSAEFMVLPWFECFVVAA